MSYRLVRVNTPDHNTRERAFADMVSIVERGFYWKQSQVPDIPSGTQMIGMGSHGGRGLFIVGVTTSEESRTSRTATPTSIGSRSPGRASSTRTRPGSTTSRRFLVPSTSASGPT
jgi:hypothetical protein